MNLWWIYGASFFNFQNIGDILQFLSPIMMVEGVAKILICKYINVENIS